MHSTVCIAVLLYMYVIYMYNVYKVGTRVPKKGTSFFSRSIISLICPLIRSQPLPPPSLAKNWYNFMQSAASEVRPAVEYF